MPNRRLSDDVAVECARIAAAYYAMLSASLAQLLMHYGSRIAALALCRRGDQTGALAALRQERDAALATLRTAIRAQQRHALARARAKRRRRYRVSVGVLRPVSPSRPQRLIRKRTHGAHPG
jgi:hypothetical protein